MKITARHLSGQIIDVELEGPIFKSITPNRKKILDLPWIAPGLVDLQINGFAGVDFNRAIPSDEAWKHATDQLYAHGCTGFLVTLITNSAAGSRQRLSELAARLRKDPFNCLGLHLEGPWLNPAPAFRGAHRAEWMTPASLAQLHEWQDLAGDLLKVITLAPEISPEACLEVIRAGRADGIQFFVGHSDARGAILEKAVVAGIVGWTHLGNAAPASAPKFDNVLLHALSQTGLMASLIPDGLHMPAYAFRALARALDQFEPSRLLLTTDAMAGAAASPGTYSLGEVEVQVGEDGAARLPAGESAMGRLAGSTLTPFQGVFHAERMSDLLLETVWKAFSTRPASTLGFSHDLKAGNSADFCLLSPETQPYLLATYHQGKCVYEAP